jgi:hypothetical protein
VVDGQIAAALERLAWKIAEVGRIEDVEAPEDEAW